MKRFLMVAALATLAAVTMAPFHTAESTSSSAHGRDIPLGPSRDTATGPGWENATGRTLPGAPGTSSIEYAVASALAIAGTRPYGRVSTHHAHPNSVPILHTVNNYAEWKGKSKISLSRTLRVYEYDDWTLSTPKFFEERLEEPYSLWVKVDVRRQWGLVLPFPGGGGFPIGGGHKLVVVEDDYYSLRMDPVPDYQVNTTPSGNYWRTYSGEVVSSKAVVDGEFAGDKFYAVDTWSSAQRR